MRHDKEVTIGLLDQLHPDRYRGDTHLALECRAWLQNTPDPSLGRVLMMGFLLNQGLIFMAQPHAASDDADDLSWGALIESKQIMEIIKDTTTDEHTKLTLCDTGVASALVVDSNEEDTVKLDADLSAFEKELHALSL